MKQSPATQQRAGEAPSGREKVAGNEMNLAALAGREEGGRAGLSEPPSKCVRSRGSRFLGGEEVFPA
ncbi:hypothetical protein HPB50_022869 [Hyalomma asiaticum]|uniref:Uncharacterized protein n=1 Tax=Hyalomma asiaticum TaxID=266040 RepID=A0ACB7T6E2_HYAAI|nr:hypothetical protein HPB50_022869 [Hyalomma asiaticum]